MKILKSHIQLTALVLSFVFTNTVLATESTTNENKDNGAANTISNADLTNNANSDATSPVAQASTAVVSDQQASQAQTTINDVQNYRKQMDERRRQVQEAQLEAYNRFLERRKQYSANNQAFNNTVPAHIQESRDAFIKQMEERRNAFIKEMEERRALNIKMMEQHRKAADKRRAEMQLKMHQTKATSDLAGKA